MDNKTRIFIGVACYKPYNEFMESLSCFLQNCSLKYNISCYMVYGKSLVDAQNDIAEQFMLSGSDYLLMLEDDHWGHTVDMLDDLIQCDKMVCGIKYYSRHYPFVVMPMDNKGFEDSKEKFEMNISTPKTKYAICGLTGFGMTLIKREVFNVLDKPYFRLNTTECGELQKGYATDQDFCNRLRGLGHEIYGCFSHCLTHRGINDSTVDDIRENEMKKFTVKKLQLVSMMKKRRLNNGKSVVGIPRDRD